MTAAAETERARSALAAIDPGCARDDWVRAAMAAKAAGLSLDDFTDWSSGAGNFKGEADCRSVWNSISDDGGIGAGTLFATAQTHGWRPEASPSINPPLRRIQRQERPKQPERPAPFDPQWLWDESSPAAVDHPYIARKLGIADGLRVFRGELTIAGQNCDGALVLPMRAPDGRIVDLQLIPTEGRKVFLPSIKIPEDAHLVIGGEIQAGRSAFLCEGIGQAWAAHQATGMSAVVCFGWGRVAKVAAALRAAHPGAQLVIVPDAGKEEQAAAIARETEAAYVEMPDNAPSNFDINDLQRESGLKAVADLLGAEQRPAQRFRFQSAADLLNAPPQRWRVRGVLPETGIAAIFGPSGSGKSFLVLDLAFAVAEGAEWFGHRVTAAPVAYLAFEGQGGIGGRVRAYQARHGQAEGVRFLLESLSLLNGLDVADLARDLRAAGCANGVVFVDTLNRAAPGADENDAQTMGLIIDATKRLQEAIGGLVVLVHHSGKDVARGMRGHSSLFASLDAAIEVERTNDFRSWKVAKAKDGRDGDSHPFRLEVVEIGTDDEGEPMTSCTIGTLGNDAPRRKRPSEPKGANQKIVFSVVEELLKQGRHLGEGGAPAGRPCVRSADVIEACRGRIEVEPRRIPERVSLAINGLVSSDCIVLREGWIWLP